MPEQRVEVVAMLEVEPGFMDLDTAVGTYAR